MFTVPVWLKSTGFLNDTMVQAFTLNLANKCKNNNNKNQIYWWTIFFWVINYLCLRYDSRIQLSSLWPSCQFSNSETGTRKTLEFNFVSPCVLDSSTTPQEQFCFKWPCRDEGKQVQWKHTRIQPELASNIQMRITQLPWMPRGKKRWNKLFYIDIWTSSHIFLLSENDWEKKEGLAKVTLVYVSKLLILSKVIQIGTLSTKELLKQFTITVIYRRNII